MAAAAAMQCEHSPNSGIQFLNRGCYPIKWDKNWCRGLVICVLAREKLERKYFLFNSLTAIDAHERQFFDKLLWGLVTSTIFVRC